MKADSKLPFFAYSSEGILQQSLQIKNTVKSFTEDGDFLRIWVKKEKGETNYNYIKRRAVARQVEAMGDYPTTSTNIKEAWPPS
jgi:hypothetical protein